MSRNQRLLVAATAVLVAASRFLARFRTPWDWDELLFCLAVRDYNVQAHHPHPPGFPLYVGLAKVVRLIADSDFHALQTVNFIAAIAVFPLLYRLARAFGFDFATAYVSALIFTLLPNVWYYGGGAFSDVPALAFFLAAGGTYLTARTARSHLLGGFLLACGLLIRPHSALTMIYPWSVATLRLIRARRIALLAASGLMIGVIVATGYGAAIHATGLDEYILTLGNHAKYVQRTDSVESPFRPPLATVLRMQLDPFNAGKVSLLISLLALAGIIGGRRRAVAGVLLTYLPWFFFVTLTLHWSGFSRHSIPYMAMFAMLSAEGIRVVASLTTRIANRFTAGEAMRGPEISRIGEAARIVLVLAIVGRLVQWTLPALEQPRRLPSPPVAMTEWVAAHFDPRTTTLLVDDSMWPWVRYYLGTFRQKKVPDDVPAGTVRNDGEWLLSADPSQSTRTIEFTWKRNRTWNVVAQRYFEVYLQPGGDVATFGKGWHGLESAETGAWRWMGRQSVTSFPPIEGPADLELEFEVHIDPNRGSNRVTFTVNGERLATQSYTRSEQKLRLHVEAPRANTANVLRIDVEDAMYDPRELSLKLNRWGWRPR